MNKGSTDLSLTYESPPATSNAQRLSVRLLIVAAAMFAVDAVDYFGFDVGVWFAPATKTAAAQAEWYYNYSFLKIWRDDLTGSLLHASVCAICIALLLVSAWGVRRRRRWAAIMGIVVSLLLGVGPVLTEILAVIELARGAWAVFDGGRDGIGLGVLHYFWVLCLGLIFLIIVIQLWSVVRQTAVGSDLDFTAQKDRRDDAEEKGGL